MRAMAGDRQNCQMVRVAGNRDTTPGSCEPGGAAEPRRVFSCAQGDLALVEYE